MIIAFSNGTAKNLFEPKNMEPSSANINFEGIMASLPGALFAFNGFLCVGDIKNSIDNPEKKTPIIVIVSVSLISVIYVGCSLFLIFNGNAGGNVLDIFGNTGKPYMAAILFLLTVGSVCSLQGCGDVNYETIVETDIICCSNAIKKINAKKENLGTFVLAESILILHSIVLIIPAAILGTDDVVDIASNFVVFFNYILLSVLIIALVYKNFSKKYDIKIKPFVAACAIFASLFLLFSTSYLAIYVPLSDIIIRPNEINDGNGVFFSPHHLTYLVADIVLLLSTLYTPVLYVINELIEKNKK
jgi:amino acid transporter